MARNTRSAAERLQRIQHAAQVATTVAELRAAGVSTPLEISNVLNARGILTVSGKAWTQIEVMRLDKRPKVRKPLKRMEWHPEKAREKDFEEK